MIRISVTELHRNPAAYFDRVIADGEPILVTHANGKGNAVVVSEADFMGWQETAHLLSSPKNAERLLASIRQIEPDKTASSL